MFLPGRSGSAPLSIPIPNGSYSSRLLSEYLSIFSRKPSLISRGMAEQMVQKDWTCDITKAKTMLGFQPQFSFHRGPINLPVVQKSNWL